eukprot:SAG11_NODE_47_length_20431_cov_7.472752_20_plen_100_part_00
MAMWVKHAEVLTVVPAVGAGAWLSRWTATVTVAGAALEDMGCAIVGQGASDVVPRGGCRGERERGGAEARAAQHSSCSPQRQRTTLLVINVSGYSVGSY